MVAPHVEKQLTRSLVRVPNSGAERPHEVHLLDLSRVSSAAALVQAMHDLPANLFASRRHMQTRPTPLPTDIGLMKPSGGSTSPSEPQLPVGNGLVQQGAAAYVSSADTTTSLVELESRTGFHRGTSPSLNAPNGNVTPSSSSATLSPPGGRKRPLSVVRQDAAHTKAATPTAAGEMRLAKVPKTTARNPGQPPRCAPPRRRATKEQLLREMEQLRTENEALRSGYEFYRNHCLSMLNQQRRASSGVPLGLLVH